MISPHLKAEVDIDSLELSFVLQEQPTPQLSSDSVPHLNIAQQQLVHTLKDDTTRTRAGFANAKRCSGNKNTWVEDEDVQLIRVMMQNKGILESLPLNKPRKKFWEHISKELLAQCDFFKNFRQCRDRFKSLFSKACNLPKDYKPHNEREKMMVQLPKLFKLGTNNDHVTLNREAVDTTILRHLQAELSNLTNEVRAFTNKVELLTNMFVQQNYQIHHWEQFQAGAHEKNESFFASDPYANAINFQLKSKNLYNAFNPE